MTGYRRPPATQDALPSAVALHQRGKLGEAEEIYRNILARDPRNAGALHLLGLVHLQRGDLRSSRELIAESIRLDSRNAVSRNNLGAVLLQLGEHGEALAAFDGAVALKPDYAEAINNSGNALVALGRHAEALGRYDRASSLGLDVATLHVNRGIALHGLGRLDDALASYDRAISISPGSVDAHVNRAETLRRLGRHAEAIESCDLAIGLDGQRPEAHVNRGAALVATGRLEEALESFDRAIAAAPGSAVAHRNRGDVLIRLGRITAALESLDRALSLAPGDPDALLDRATALLESERYGEAITACDRALAVGVDRAELHFDRGLALVGLGRHEEALASVERALALDPRLPYAAGMRLDLRMRLCQWDGFPAEFEAIVGSTLRGERCVTPLTILSVPAPARAQLECARTYARHKYPAVADASNAARAFTHERIRIGYFSSDFRDHPVAHLLSEVLERHDRSRFEITAFSTRPSARDPWRDRIERGVDRFVDVSAMDDASVARLAHGFEIDIAVDLNGFTLGARTGIFARRCAPVQVNYLGFPGTSGADYFEYLVADATVVPEDHEPFYTERIVRLPHCYAPSDSTKPISDRRFSRAELGLPDHGTVFCSFNSPHKITPDVFEVWMRLLLKSPGSCLWLRGASPSVEGNLRVHARELGVSASRLVFAPPVDLAEHFSRHRAADLFLDTFHYNAHTTANDALWAGLPVITRMGDTFASRVASSMLRAIGLPELIAHTIPEYEALALELSSSPARLADIRAKLAAHRDAFPLFDTARFVRHLETAFLRMHERRVAGLAPESFAVRP